MIETSRDPELQDEEPRDDEGDAQEGKDEVQEQSEESFPASDPPSY